MSAAVPDLPAGTQTVELALPDGYGVLRGKRVPASAWAHACGGITLTNVVLSWSPVCEVRDTDVWGGPASGWSDISAVPILDSLRTVPWRPGAAFVLCEARMPGSGEPVPVDPRAALARVLAGAARAGYAVQIGCELEFYLLDAATGRPRDEAIGCYGLSHGGVYEHLLAPLREQLVCFGVPVEACHPEYGPGQFELSIVHADALSTADAAVLLRHAVKEVAAQHGLVATFMAKPLTHGAGSGLHVHHSLWRDGRNAFSSQGLLSEVGRWYLGGLQRFLPELSLFGTPTPNGMKRRRPRQFTPLTNAWARDNRTTALRVVEGDPGAVRIEQRDAGAESNPYSVIAAQVAAGLRGVQDRLEPQPECFGEVHSGQPLPTSIPEAVAALRGSALAADTFDPLLLRTVVDCALHEHDVFARTVSDLELQRYRSVL